MTIVYKTDKEHWLDNLKMVGIVAKNEYDAVAYRIERLKECIDICDESKLERMYNKIELAGRLLAEAWEMGLRDDN